MHVGDRLTSLLIEYGVEHVFGVPGGQTFALYHGIMRSGGSIQHILMRDERSAGYAADAWARLTGRTGVCDATVGAGAANLIAPVAEAYASSIPILALISDIPRAWEYRRVRGNASQGMRQIEVFQTISKWQATVNDPEALEDMVDTAFRIANTGRPGPVVLAIPEDVFMAPSPSPKYPTGWRSARYPWYPVSADPHAISEAVQWIRRARKPALLVGGGALIAGAFSQVQQLAEYLGAPVATSITGKGILPDTHPLAIGVAGLMASPLANEILEEADLLLFIGTKAGQIATRNWTIPQPGTPTIHIDIDPEEIRRNFPQSLPLIGDARLVLEALLTALCDVRKESQWDQASFARRVQEWYRRATADQPQSGEPLKPQRVMDIINQYFSDDDMAVCDASLASGWAATYLRLGKAGRRFFAPRGLAGLGWGTPAAVGLAIATGGRQRILLFAGDGGFAYSLQEMEVMVRLKLPILAILLNNDTLAWVKHGEQRRGWEGFISTDFSHIDFATVARGFGARGHVVVTEDELVSVLREEQNPEGPVIIDIRTDQWESPVQYPPPLQAKVPVVAI